MKIVYLTAGAAGMYCGSCMHDNALAKAILAAGHECLLQPLYTPIRTDEASVASDRLFFGGIHIYLLDRMPWMGKLPRPLRRLLDFPPLVRWVTRRARSTDADRLGHLTVSMLAGEHGPQADEVARLADWLASEQPDALVLTNLLIGGSLPVLRRKLPNTRFVVLLQGDDIFLDHLSKDYQQQVRTQLRQLVPHVDHLIVNSDYYAALMAELLDVPQDRFVIHPLTIDTTGYPTEWTPLQLPPDAAQQPFRIGYLARLAPEKGFDRLVDAFIEFAANRPNVHLEAAGYLAETNADWKAAQVEKIRQARLMDRWHDRGSISLEEKIRWLGTLDVLCVPTRYRDPKGLFTLEALAAGTPVVMPDHGALGELVRHCGGGLTFAPEDERDMQRALAAMYESDDLRQQSAATGHAKVHQEHTIEKAAQRLLELLR
ncbi:MAG: glycosyltransferase family 4 protein [Planctomycetota bacterium]